MASLGVVGGLVGWKRKRCEVDRRHAFTHSLSFSRTALFAHIHVRNIKIN